MHSPILVAAILVFLLCCFCGARPYRAMATTFNPMTGGQVQVGTPEHASVRDRINFAEGNIDKIQKFGAVGPFLGTLDALTPDARAVVNTYKEDTINNVSPVVLSNGEIASLPKSYSVQPGMPFGPGSNPISGKPQEFMSRERQDASSITLRKPQPRTQLSNFMEGLKPTASLWSL